MLDSLASLDVGFNDHPSLTFGKGSSCILIKESLYTSGGHLIHVWRQKMPRINDQILDCIIYLYPDIHAANSGEKTGGTGFLVGVPSEQHEGIMYIYAVTNSHVVREAKSPIIRFNTQQGDTASALLTENHWVHHPDADDVAVALIGGLDPITFKFRCLPISMFLSQEIMVQHNIGPGDDVFMVGRFIGHDGRQRNLPSVRFGNISMMPWEAIEHPRGHKQESFLVESRSLSGNSGSPVFVHIADAAKRPGDQAVLTLGRETGPWLLGVDWGHVYIYEKVKEKDKKTDVSDGYVVQSNSGQMAVVPAWKLHELLNLDAFVAARKEEDEKIAKHKESSPVVLDWQTSPGIG